MHKPTQECWNDKNIGGHNMPSMIRIGLSIVHICQKLVRTFSKVPIHSGGHSMCCIHVIELKEISYAYLLRIKNHKMHI